MSKIPTSNELIKKQMEDVNEALFTIMKHEMEKRKEGMKYE